MVIDFDYNLAMELDKRPGVKPYKLTLRNGNPIKILSWSLRNGNNGFYMAIAIEREGGNLDELCSRDLSGRVYSKDGKYDNGDIIMDINIAQVIVPGECWIIRDKAGNEFQGIVDKVVGIHGVSSWDSCDILFKWCFCPSRDKQYYNVKANCSWARKAYPEDRKKLIEVLKIDNIYSDSNSIALMIANEQSDYYNAMVRCIENNTSNDIEKKIARNAFLMGWQSKTEWNNFKNNKK